MSRTKNMDENFLSGLMGNDLNDDNHEVVDNMTILGYLPLGARESLWAFSLDILGKDRMQDGEAGQACRIVELFYANIVKDILDQGENIASFRLEPDFALLVFATCIRLVSKAQGRTNYLKGTTIIQAFAERGMHYTLERLNEVEWMVYARIKAHVSIWSNVQKVRFVAQELDFSEQDVGLIGMIMDWMEMQLPNIMNYLKKDSRETIGTSTFEKNVNLIRSSHLIAAVVVATDRIVCTNSTNRRLDSLLPTLARWCQCPKEFIEWISVPIQRNTIKHMEGTFKTNLKKSIDVTIIWM